MRKEEPTLKQFFDSEGKKIILDHAQEQSFGAHVEIDPNYPFETNVFFPKDSSGDLPELEEINQQLAKKQMGNPRNKL